MKKIVEYGFLTFGASIVALGLETMLAPNGLVDGGVTALSKWPTLYGESQFMLYF